KLVGQHDAGRVEPQLDVDQAAIGQGDPATLLGTEDGRVPLDGPGCAIDDDVVGDHGTHRAPTPGTGTRLDCSANRVAFLHDVVERRAARAPHVPHPRRGAALRADGRAA